MYIDANYNISLLTQTKNIGVLTANDGFKTFFNCSAAKLFRLILLLQKKKNKNIYIYIFNIII